MACERDAEPIYKLPGETDESAIIRSEQIDAELAIVRRTQAEQRELKSAPRIYIAEVVSRLENGGGAEVKPLKAYKGVLPPLSRKLILVPASLCTGEEISDGEGWRGKPGELVVIFDGLEKTMTRPNGVDSLLATSIRSPALSSWLQQFGTVVRQADADRE